MHINPITQTPLPPHKSRRYTSKFKRLMWIHWTMASILLLLYITGIGVAHLPQISFPVWLSGFLHQSIGITFLLMLIGRILTLLQVFSTKYLKRSPKVDSTWFKTVCFRSILYLCMAIVPVSGICLRNFMGVNTTFFGISVPSLFGLNADGIELMRNVHFWYSYLFLVFIGLHAVVHWKTARSLWKNAFSISQKSNLRRRSLT